MCHCITHYIKNNHTPFIITIHNKSNIYKYILKTHFIWAYVDMAKGMKKFKSFENGRIETNNRFVKTYHNQPFCENVWNE